jgi:hypothetical protein
MSLDVHIKKSTYLQANYTVLFWMILYELKFNKKGYVFFILTVKQILIVHF